jgi:hypothetical protein
MHNDPQQALELMLSDLCPEELEPRLELQVLMDPVSIVSMALRSTNNINGGNNNIKG